MMQLPWKSIVRMSISVGSSIMITIIQNTQQKDLIKSIGKEIAEEIKKSRRVV